MKTDLPTCSIWFAVQWTDIVSGCSYSHWWAYENLRKKFIAAGCPDFLLPEDLTASYIKNTSEARLNEVVSVEYMEKFLHAFCCETGRRVRLEFKPYPANMVFHVQCTDAGMGTAK